MTSIPDLSLFDGTEIMPVYEDKDEGYCEPVPDALHTATFWTVYRIGPSSHRSRTSTHRLCRRAQCDSRRRHPQDCTVLKEDSRRRRAYSLTTRQPSLPLTRRTVDVRVWRPASGVVTSI